MSPPSTSSGPESLQTLPLLIRCIFLWDIPAQTCKYALCKLHASSVAISDFDLDLWPSPAGEGHENIIRSRLLPEQISLQVRWNFVEQFQRNPANKLHASSQAISDFDLALWPCPEDGGHSNLISSRPPPKEVSLQVWWNSAQWLQRNPAHKVHALFWAKTSIYDLDIRVKVTKI